MVSLATFRLARAPRSLSPCWTLMVSPPDHTGAQQLLQAASL